ncbi:MAG: LPS-assembly protein LptD, partial [Bryobacterales bacterium]|nr:LPS-assembly protein LptD [Bryobacterales bacterium]
KPVRPNAPGPNDVYISALVQESQGTKYKLRGKAKVETRETLLEADESDYDEESGDAEARGNVHFHHFLNSEDLHASRIEYNVSEETGKFYDVRGSSPAKIDPRPGVLNTTNPFVFEGKWAERIKDRYVLYDGFVTNCRVPKPTWKLTAPKFDIIPNDRAIAHRAWFKVRGIPLLYAPKFYKSLEKRPRKSGFLTPSIGNSSRRGTMAALGYYWAINRSYDALYRGQWFSARGLAHTVDFRGKPRHGSDFNFFLYGVNDKGLLLDDGSRLKQGGYLISFDGHSDLGKGWYARGAVNYLSNFTFRQAFTENFNEAIFSEVQSVGFVTKHWSSYGVNIAFTRKENYQSSIGDRITIRRLPQIEFNSRDRQIWDKIPVWVSLESSAGLLRRNQPLFQTRAFVQRLDLEPRVMTAFRWKDWSILPSYSVRETFVASQFDAGTQTVRGDNIRRSTRELGVDLVPPSLAKVMDAPKWLGVKMKHVIEPRVSFRQVSGIEDFKKLIRFDETELLTNTREMELSLTNRVYVKNEAGATWEALTWQIWHRRYFDPTFGGAITEDQRNVFLSGTQITGYTFFNGPRRYSPIVSALRLSPAPGPMAVEWRQDYDPLLKRFTNSTVTVDNRFGKYFVSVGHAYINGVPNLSPPYNQFRGLVGIGNEQRRGWSAAFSAFYDFREGQMQFITTQVGYNLDCCGLSMQYRRFSFGTRNENQYRVAFVIANIGSFGTLKRQERIF